MKNDDAVKLLDDYLKLRCVTGAEWKAWQTLKAHCTQSASAQQLKPKMPSEEDLRKMLVGTGEISEFGLDTNGAGRIIHLCHTVIARHFGH